MKEKEEEVRSYYTHFAEAYDEAIHQEKDYTAFQKLPKWLMEELPALGLSVIDLGCGTGLSSSSLIEGGARVVGVDLTPNMLEKASRFPFAQLLCQSIEEPLPFPDSSFDAALLIGVMEFIQRPFALFKEVRRLMRPGGKVACTIPENLPSSMEEKVGIKTFSLETIEALFCHIGFSIERKERFQGFISQGQIVPYTGYLLTAGTFTSLGPPLASHQLIVKESPGKGRGVFTTKPIAQGTWIEHAPLLTLSEKEWEQVSPTLLYHYAFDWGVDGRQAALALGFGSLYNHSYEPNSYYLRRPLENALDFFALRNILEGEEILINYNGEPSCKDPVWFDQEKDPV